MKNEEEDREEIERKVTNGETDNVVVEYEV